jgi:5'-nucleotidase
MHGDFLAEVRAGESKMIGGLALLSGYVNKVRREEENVLYVISGDMVQGSIIDTESPAPLRCDKLPCNSCRAARR